MSEEAYYAQHRLEYGCYPDEDQPEEYRDAMEDTFIEDEENNLSGGVGSTERQPSNVLDSSKLPSLPELKLTPTTDVVSPAQNFFSFENIKRMAGHKA